MYKLQNNSVIESSNQCEYQGQIWGNFNAFLSRQTIEDRQNEGWYLNIIEGDVTEITIDKESDTIIVPKPIIPPYVEQPFEISKLKLGRAFRSLGQEENFEAYIASDINLARDWDRAISLMSNDPLVLSACEMFKVSLGLTQEQIDTMLKGCRVDG